ncbi:MAG: DNA polymerase III subunit alpha [Bacteroidota bacterium]
MTSFTHLHCHTQYSLLDGTAKINDLIAKTHELGMHTLAITDHGNMFGVPHFVAAAQKKGIKPIIGCEFYLAPNMHDYRDKTRYHQLLLAKNSVGYKNLVRLASMGFLEGYYYKPRIDRKLLQKHREGLIATTSCLNGEVPQTILRKGEAAAEKVFLAWLELFGEDYYIELQRHGLEQQDTCNALLCKWARKYQVKVIASNDVHYVVQADSLAQDILLCLQTGKDYNDPHRMRFERDAFFLKSPQEMATLFQDIPEAIANTQEIVDKVDTLRLEQDVLLPIFQVPSGFPNQDAYLRHLAIEGAKNRYGTLTPELETRLNHELGTIQQMGFPGYFLIVQDFISAARQLGVLVGPGRGSVAGSAVAYCIGITDIDPLQYNLVFERFLNPERISMPDIDIDFDDEGRQKVIQYVVDKYGRNQVAHIITFGSMGAKSAIRDVARVLSLPLSQSNYMAKLVPDKLGTTLAQALEEVPELNALSRDTEKLEGKVLSLAKTLEGSARHTGVHAAGVIIAPDDLLTHIPVKTDKNSDLYVTQYDGSVVERMGMLKMDFLGLKTLSIIKDTLALIKSKHQKTLELEQIPLDDTATFQLYQRGDTIATFQFESEGMRQWLKKLRPTQFEDLIAMNALYRPGPMQFIPHFIARKHGQEKVEYPHPLLVDILEHTYGIMVYQEQVMQTARIIAGYTLGEADLLRKAMGKKQTEEMAKQRTVFVAGAHRKHNIAQSQAIAIFETMERFAQYGFPRAHAAAYSVIAYQTAYLKAHYPAEYMASVLTHNQHDISKITFFMNECLQQDISMLGPDINESQVDFDVTPDRHIRFGLGGIKGTSTAAVQHIIDTRAAGGKFKDIFSFVERINLRTINKKTLESLAMAGALDSWADCHRKQYLWAPEGEPTLLEKAIQYGQQVKREKAAAQPSLFAADAEAQQRSKPPLPTCEPYGLIDKLRMEKEVTGFYISGHPLDTFQVELTNFCNCHTQNALSFRQKEVRLAGLLVACHVRYSKQGRPFGSCTLEDYEGTLDLTIFGEDFMRHQHLLSVGTFVYIIGTVAERYNQKDVWELRPQKMYLLSEIRNKMTRKLWLNLSVDDIDSVMTEKMTQIISECPGECDLHIAITAPDGQLAIELEAPHHRISPTTQLLDSLDNLAGVSYRLVS